MSTAEPPLSTPNTSGATHKNSLLTRIEFEKIQKWTHHLGMAVAVICFTVACLHLRMRISPRVDFALLAAIWIVLLLTGLGLWILVVTWTRAHKLPATPAYSSSDEGAEKLDQARIKWSGIARSHSQKRRHWVVVASLLSPVAVLSLSLEILLVPGGSMAITLILFEILVIGLALTTIYVRWPFGKAHETWVPARLRAELLRREVYFYRARVGPYLNSSAHEERAEERIREIGITQSKTPEEELCRLAALLDMEYSSCRDAKRAELHHAANGSDTLSRSWSDELENSARLPIFLHKDLVRYNTPEPNFRQHYLEERVQSQKNNYFKVQKELHERLDIVWETLSILTLWFALAMACLHFGLMTGLQSTSDLSPAPPSRDIEKWIEVSALTLPPLGGFFIALRTYLESHRLSRSYDDQFWQLDRLEARLKSLRPEDPDADLELKRLVLQTEMLLSHEVRRWWHIVGPEIPKGS